MGKVYRRQLVEGVTIPAVIHNSSYFLIQMAVYEDGTVSCWHKSDLIQFQNDLKKGWVVPAVPCGKSLCVHGLGSFPVLDARWHYHSQSFYTHVEDVVRSLNPEMANLYHTTRREEEKWNKARVSWSASPTPCKLKDGLGYHLQDGDSCYIFYRTKKALYLTPVTCFEDKTVQIDAAGSTFYSQEEIHEMFDQKMLDTAPVGKEWVTIDGLGKVLLEADPEYQTLPAQEKYKEIEETLKRLSGEEDALDLCRAAHYEYLTDPNEWTREALRKAYEAVPEHKRMYLGDMDTRDSDFIRILQYPDEKREV